MNGVPNLPTRRKQIRANDLDGNEVVLAVSVAKKLYVCPSCRGRIELGQEHVLVRYPETGGRGHHQHWHRDCVQADLLRELRQARWAAPDAGDNKRTRGQRRQASLERRRR